jgi:MFS family permease
VVGFVWLALMRDRVGPAVYRAGLGATDTVRLARHRQLLRAAIVWFLDFGGVAALFGLLPRVLAQGGVPRGRLGLAVAAWLTALAAASFFGPWLSDRSARRRPFVVGGALLAAAALGGASLGLGRLPAGATTGLLALAALGAGSFAPLLLTIPLELPTTGTARAGAGLGFLVAVGQVGALVVPTLSGAVLESTGDAATALAGLAVAYATIVLPAAGLREPARRAEPAGRGPTGPCGMMSRSRSSRPLARATLNV